jgi:hypothetical protein
VVFQRRVSATGSEAVSIIAPRSQEALAFRGLCNFFWPLLATRLFPRRFGRRLFSRAAIDRRRGIVRRPPTIGRLLAFFVARRLGRVFRTVMPSHETGRGGNESGGSGVGPGSGGGTPSGAGTGFGPGVGSTGCGGLGCGGVTCMIMNA